MTIKNEYVSFDGRQTGIIVEVLGNVKKKYIYSKANYIRLFKNISIAEVTAKSIVGKNVRLKYHFRVNENLTIPIGSCHKINDHWEAIVNDTRYIISEVKENGIVSLGYIAFEHGDTVRCDKEYGYKRRKELLNYVKEVAVGIFAENTNCTIDKIVRVDDEIILHVKNSTAQIHILSNSKLMDMNQARKEVNARCIPFKKEMDKFTTLYMYTCKDLAETARLGSDEVIETIIGYIIDDLKYFYQDAEPEFIPLEFSGYINISEES